MDIGRALEIVHTLASTRPGARGSAEKEALDQVHDLIVNNFAEGDYCNCPAQKTLDCIRDVLFLDEDDDAQPVYNQDKDCGSDELGAIVNIVIEHFGKIHD